MSLSVGLTRKPPPQSTDVIVIGGGPAGSSVAALLAAAGIEVVLLERAQFPRNQVGESLIPHFWKFADLTGVSGKIEHEGFVTKAGGIIAWDSTIRQIAFSRFGYRRPALHVERDRFDSILLEHARSCGARIIQPAVAKKVDLNDPRRVTVHYHDKADQTERRIRARIVVDASGPASLLANQLKARRLIDSERRFIALWGYFRGARYFDLEGTSHAPDQVLAVKPATFVQSHPDGWLWHIVLRQSTSVGLVIHTDRLKGLDNDARRRYFLDTVHTMPHLRDLLAPATLIEGSIRFRPDYSYYSTRPCGPNFYCIGDAAGFVDPIYSHGVQNAFYNAATAATAIEASLAKPDHSERFSRICQSRMQQFYSFSRALALGDDGSGGINRALVRNFMRTMPPLERELMLAAAQVTDRADHFRRLARDAGLPEAAHCGNDSDITVRLKELDRPSTPAAAGRSQRTTP